MIESRYTPLDELLDQPATRVLRGLRYFDWVSSFDLFHALGAPDYQPDQRHTNTERNALSAALTRLVKMGFVERGNRQVDGYVHRITPAGRAELKRRLAGECLMARKLSERKPKCSECGETGHYKRTCLKRGAA